MLPSFGTSPSLALSSQNFTHPRPGLIISVPPTPYHSGTSMAQNRQNSPEPLPVPLNKDTGEKKGHLQK